ncbi:MAG: hypothetical protein M3O64_00715 [Chloroflexota bacterium]|nr:hypothetical protein [Chloroflexota bacterium]
MTDTTAPNLRPLGVGDIVDRTIGLYRASPALFLVLAALPYIVLALVSLALNLVFVRTTPLTKLPTNVFDPNGFSTSFTPEEIAGFAVFGAVITVVSVIVLSVQAAAIVDAMSKRYLGQPTTIGESLRAGLRASVRLILASIIAFVSFIVLITMAVVVLAIVTAAIGNPLPAIIGGIAVFVLILYVVASWMPLPAVVTLEGRGPVDGIRRAWGLAGGARWRILGLLTLVSILQGILGILFAFIFLGTIVTEGVAKTVLQEVANLAVNALWAPIQWGVFTLLYYDLRVRKEAFDLQLAAESIPRAT